MGYLMARFLVEYDLMLHACVFMGNHYHLLVSGDEPRLAEFAQALNSQIARYLNWLHGLKHVNLWAPVPPGQIECLDPESAWDDVIYLAVNPVAALIVSRPENHPGIAVLPSAWGRPVTFEPPPNEFFKYEQRGEDPITIVPVPPPGFDGFDLENLRAKARHEIEMRCRRIRRQGTTFRGYEDVDIFDCPASLWARRCGTNVPTYMPSARLAASGGVLFESCPRYQACDKALLKLAHDLDRQFWSDYRTCREAERNGEQQVVYPEGTSLYRRRNLVDTEPLIDRGWYPLLSYG